uniref:PiggyBac transposable element-derived protein domain-containing protein n=1 Tax=Kryptolebias marmoratus TaxID=37003 RepID=A0A3Q2ZCT4_KRYMA
MSFYNDGGDDEEDVFQPPSSGWSSLGHPQAAPRSSPATPHPDLFRSEDTKTKRKQKGPHTSVHPKRGWGDSAAQEEKWHNKEEEDKRSQPGSHQPQRPGPLLTLSLFQLFFSPAVVRTIIDNTNINAAIRLRPGKKFVCKVLTVRDFYIFMAILIFSSLVSVHHRLDYWRKAWPYNFPFPGDKMARDHFEAVLWSLHLSISEEKEDNERKKNTADYDRLFKIKPLYTETFCACRLLHRLYLGFLCIHWKECLHHRARPELLFSDGPPSIVFPWWRVHTFVDNFYTSPTLFQDLSARNIDCCGTIRKSRIGFPQTDKNDLQKKMDTREITMCCTVHAAFSGKSIQRRVKSAGAWQSKSIPAPDPVIDYNQNMGGVDLSDALIGYYSVHHKSLKWYKTFFYHFMDIATVNSFILYKELFKLRKDPASTGTPNHKKIKEQLAAEMIQFAESTTPPSPQPLTCMPEYYGTDATQSRTLCMRCQEAGIPRVKTPIYCRKCQVPLCLTSTRNCFREWHDAQ